MLFQDLTWMDIEDYLQTNQRIMLITGATEQHAYLSMMTDILVPSRIAMAVSERTGILVAPPLNFGISDLFIEFPGTISLSKQTFDSILVDMVESLLHQGFNAFFILNGHGSNELPAALQDWHNDNVIRVIWHDWWRGQAAKSVEHDHNMRIDHANWGENFPFNRLKPAPAEIKRTVNLSDEEDGRSVKSILGDGSYGGLYQAGDEVMQTLFERVVNEVVALVETL
jgi:creatinine amidohydrolase